MLFCLVLQRVGCDYTFLLRPSTCCCVTAPLNLGPALPTLGARPPFLFCILTSGYVHLQQTQQFAVNLKLKTSAARKRSLRAALPGWEKFHQVVPGWEQTRSCVWGDARGCLCALDAAESVPKPGTRRLRFRIEGGTGAHLVLSCSLPVSVFGLCVPVVPVGSNAERRTERRPTHTGTPPHTHI